MKNKIYLILFGLIFFQVSCTDLDLAPESQSVSTIVYSDADSYRNFLAKIYAGLAITGQQGPAGAADIQGIDEGFSSYVRMLFYAQEFSTETTVIGWNDQTIKDFQTHSWSATDVFLNGLYSRLFYQVSLANEFLRNSTPEALAGYGIAEADFDQINEYRAEVRFLRALSYWHAIDLFGNIPFATEDSPVGTVGPAQASRAEVFNFIESELLAVEDEMAEPGAIEYPRASRAAAWTLLAKLYLNAGVYTGTDRYADCLEYCNKVISSNAFELAEDYRQNFRADNHESPEFIFAVAFDGTRTQGFGGTTFLIHAALGGTIGGGDVAEEFYGVDGGWAGYRTTEDFVNLFADISGATDSRAIFHTEGQSVDVTIENQGTYENGFGVPKFTNLDENGDPGSNLTFPDTDFPMFRLADVYLMYAEAQLNGGGGDQGTALGYLNALRERAYGNTSGNISAADFTSDYILDERGRELYLECHRRTDLVRFNQFTENGAWALKGGVDDGQPTPAFRNVYPIPSNEIVTNPRLQQNTGY